MCGASCTACVMIDSGFARLAATSAPGCCDAPLLRGADSACCIACIWRSTSASGSTLMPSVAVRGGAAVARSFFGSRMRKMADGFAFRRLRVSGGSRPCSVPAKHLPGRLGRRARVLGPHEVHGGSKALGERLLTSHEHDHMVDLLRVFQCEHGVRRIQLLRRRKREPPRNHAGEHLQTRSTVGDKSPPHLGGRPPRSLLRPKRHLHLP